ncbi:MAG: hypothetical protein ACRD8W_18165 [Nitrososphaeraceae archaeon]
MIEENNNNNNDDYTSVASDGYYPKPRKFRILHHWTREDIDKFCSEHEREGEKIFVTIQSYKKESIRYHNKEDGSFTDREEYEVSGGWSYQIHSSKDLIQFDNEDMKLLRKDIEEELR